jgi:hypothetical protein
MTQYSEAGKGDDMRPTNHKNYSSGYDTIDWSAKEVTCPNCKEKFMLSSKHPNKHYCVLPEERR